jgi:hypothetical protein
MTAPTLTNLWNVLTILTVRYLSLVFCCCHEQGVQRPTKRFFAQRGHAHIFMLHATPRVCTCIQLRTAGFAFGVSVMPFLQILFNLSHCLWGL